MAKLIDLFSVFQGLQLPTEAVPPTNPGLTRMDFVTNYIDTKLAEKEEIPEEEPEIERPRIKSKAGNKYSRMVTYARNKTPLDTVMNFFINKGLTPEQASGFAGNFLAESDLNAAAINQAEKKKGYKGYGRGIAQWSNERIQQFKEFIGKNIEDASLEEQLEFVWYEVQQRPELLSQLSKAITSEEAADLVYRGYENGSTAGLATPEQLIRSYGNAWGDLNYRVYNFDNELLSRQNKAKQALTNYQS